MGYGPITLANSGTQSQLLEQWPEGATQTFKQGVVLKLSSGNAVIGDSADPWTAADVVLGISAAPGQNLTTAGTAEKGYSEATPQNQTAAKIIPHGAWMKTGKVPMYRADGNNIFLADLKATQTFSQALVAAGTYYALKYDSTTGYYYVDSADTAGNNAVCEIVGGVSDNTAKVLFRFKAGQRYWD